MYNRYNLLQRIEGERDRLNCIISLIAKMSAACRKAQDMLTFAQYDPDVTELTNRLDLHRAQMLRYLDQILSSLLEPRSFSTSEQAENYSEFLVPVCGFRADLIDDIIVVAMPILLPRSYSHKIVAEDYGHAYATSLSYVMHRFVESLPPQQLHKYALKTISLVFVYPDNNQIPDADSFDTKAAIDAVTGHLPGGDSGQNCSFYFKSTFIPKIRGTFILISPGLDSIPAADRQHKYILLAESKKSHR